MNDKKLKVGDKVKCSAFLYSENNRFIGMVGTFNHYNKYDDEIAYIDFGQDSKEVGCLTEDIESLHQKNEQLLFNFMY